jgi:hypothetical protein
MKKTVASLGLSLALMSSTAMAGERTTDAASAVVRRPMGVVASAVHRLFGRSFAFARQPRSVAHDAERVPTGESQAGSAPPMRQDKTAAQAAAPAAPASATVSAPPVQPLE